MEPNYLTIARGYLGMREIKGPETSAKITEWLVKLKAWWRDDETPWCGVALAAWLQEAGLPYPKTYFRALSWKDYGVPCWRAELGAIAVLQREGGGHVGIVTGVTADRSHYRLIGGNQGDKVCEAWFPKERIVAFRRPGGIMLDPAPVAVLGEASKSEA